MNGGQVWLARRQRLQLRCHVPSAGVWRRSMSAFVVMAASVVLLESSGLPAVYEGFALTFPAYNAGTGFTGAWVQGGFNVSTSGYRAKAKSLSYSPEVGLQPQPVLETSGGSIFARRSVVITGAIRRLTQPLGADNTTAYISFLIEPLGTLNHGAFNGFFGLTLNGDQGRDLFAGKSGGGALTEYVLEQRGGGGQVTSGTPTVVGITRFLVIRAEFLPGNDVFTLYTDTVPGGPEPATGVAKTDLDLGTVSAIGIYSTGAFAIDEIRIGSTYADVAPCGSFVHKR